MSQSNQPESGSKTIYIVQYGSNHSQINIQGAERTAEAVSTAFRLTQGKKTLYDEAFGISDDRGNAIRQTVRYKGFLFYAASLMVGGTNEQKVALKLKAFQAPDEQLVNSYVINPENVCRFFTLRGFERIRVGTSPTKGSEINYIVETHGRNLPALMVEHKAVIARGLEARTHWNSGRFDSSIDISKRWAEDRLKLQEKREPRMDDQLKGILVDLQNDPRGGVLFINAGFTHGPFLEKLRQFPFKPDVISVFETVSTVSDDMPELVIDRSLRRGEGVGDLLYARDMLLKRGLDQLANESVRAGRLYVFGKNFETITEAIVNFVNNLSIYDIRKYCEQKQVFSTFINNSPSGQIIESVIR